MFSVLRSTRKLMHTTSMNGRAAHTSTEAYRNAVNARANSMRLRSLAFYTIAYPVISFMCNFPQLIQELLSTVLKRELRWLVFTSRLFLFSEGFFLSLTFFLYPAVQHSMRDLTNSAVQYWIVDQEEFWKMPKNEIKRRNSRKLFKKEVESASTPTEERIVRDFSSFRGRVYHFILSLTPEGRLATSR
ncbi:hypothetical protein GGH17_004054 [Coemansia sp. RSA 788]|nr:hypothetical protein GGH17_004054 [Coemansia sp. RSA 788]KAJ2144218.1 hypothetical protein IW142_003279 [Coemansia sp. RSA 564]KAJ2151835.1 hypothetical protein J3F82_003078 [Coemansia sp. RSA 637]KAJ2164033.1 hypothetical protein GGH15_004149 [Coemansia sp. RSA 562]KAJ2170946.1 hypothetical protein GGH16_003111 [Coemansia sp. RSA 560]KAJ2287324.1 hypothetical protein IW141_004918 [Coemansia sp. RSA 355]